MRVTLLTLFLACAAHGKEPSIVFDNRPESGIPRKALAQMRAESNLNPAQEKELRSKLSTQERKLFDKWPAKLHEINSLVASRSGGG